MAEAPTTTRNSLFREIGGTGLNIQSGMLQEEYRSELRGLQGVKTYNEMAETPVCGAILFVIEQMISQVEWEVKPFSEETEDEEPKDFIEGALHDMSFSLADTFSEVSTMFVHGWSFLETVYKVRRGYQAANSSLSTSKYDDGKIGWRKWALRGQNTLSKWDIDDSGGIRGMVQEFLEPINSMGDRTVTIPIQKALLFRTKVIQNNPEGQALDVNTPIYTPKGWRTIGDIQVGDQVFNSQGKATRVVNAATWMKRPCFKLTFFDRSEIIADANHEWLISTCQQRSKERPAQIKRTEEIAGSFRLSAVNRYNGINYSRPLVHEEKDLPVHPWALGYWLGNGNNQSAQQHCHLADADVISRRFIELGYFTSWYQTHGNFREASDEPNNGALLNVCDLKVKLRDLGLLGGKGHKWVPEQYLEGSEQQRRDLLAGLLDSDGHCDEYGRVEFSNTNKRLIDAVAFLVRSLGMAAHVTQSAPKDEMRGLLEVWDVKFTPTENVFWLARKNAPIRQNVSRRLHFISRIESVEPRTTKCIEIESDDHLFLAGESLIPTHNSIFRKAYRPWWLAKRLEESESISHERDGSGLPVLTTPEGFDWDPQNTTAQASLRTAEKLVTGIRRGEKEGVLLPFGWELQLLSSSSRRSADLGATITRHETRICQSVLADFIMLGQGKTGSWALAQPLSAKVLTPTGWSTMGDMKPGAEVICPDGNESVVLDMFDHGTRKAYRVKLHDGREILADADHKWVVTTPFWKRQGPPKRARLPWAPTAPEPYERDSSHAILTTKQIAERIKFGAKDCRYHIPRTKPVKFAPQEPLPIDPYVLGVLLGDGHLSLNDAPSFTSADIGVVEEVQRRLPPEYRTVMHGGGRSAPQYRITGRSGRPNQVKLALEQLSLLGTRSKTKFIPIRCFLASIEERVWLLRGLMDTDGTIATHGQVRFTTASELLRDGIVEIVRGLGGGAYINKRMTLGYPHPATGLFIEKPQTKWLITVSMPDDINPFHLQRKAERVRPSMKPQDTGIVSIEEVGEEPMRCIMVSSPSHLYLTDGYAPTHNSSDKTDMFVIALAGYLKQVKEVINRHAIPRLLELNGYDATRPPFIDHGDIETQNLAELGSYISALSTAGAIMFPDESLERHLRLVADLPPPPDPEEKEEQLMLDAEMQRRINPPEEPELEAGRKLVREGLEKMAQVREMMLAKRKAEGNGHDDSGFFLTKHGDTHDEKTHGNWADGSASDITADGYKIWDTANLSREQLDRAHKVGNAVTNGPVAKYMAAQMHGGFVVDGKANLFTPAAKLSNLRKIKTHLDAIRDNDPEAFENFRRWAVADAYGAKSYNQLGSSISVYRGGKPNEQLPIRTNVSLHREVAERFGTVKHYKIHPDYISWVMDGSSAFGEGELLIFNTRKLQEQKTAATKSANHDGA